MATSTTQSSFSVCCNTEGEATVQTQVTQTMYYIDSVLVGQASASTSLTLSQFQAIVAALESAN